MRIVCTVVGLDEAVTIVGSAVGSRVGFDAVVGTGVVTGTTEGVLLEDVEGAFVTG